MTTDLLPTEQAPIKLDPDLAEAVGAVLAKVDPDDLEVAQDAVRAVYASGTMGTFADLLGSYREAIEDAIGYELEEEPAEA